MIRKNIDLGFDLIFFQNSGHCSQHSPHTLQNIHINNLHSNFRERVPDSNTVPESAIYRNSESVLDSESPKHLNTSLDISNLRTAVHAESDGSNKSILMCCSSKHEELKSCSSKDEDIKSIFSKDKLKSCSSRDEELKSCSSKDEALKSCSSKDEALKSCNSKDEELKSRSSKDEELKSCSFKDEELQSCSSKDEELKSTFSKEDELNSIFSKDELESSNSTDKDLKLKSDNSKNDDLNLSNTCNENRKFFESLEKKVGNLAKQMENKAKPLNLIEKPLNLIEKPLNLIDAEATGVELMNYCDGDERAMEELSTEVVSDYSGVHTQVGNCFVYSTGKSSLSIRRVILFYFILKPRNSSLKNENIIIQFIDHLILLFHLKK